MKETYKLTTRKKYRQECIEAMKKSDNFILIIEPKQIVINKDILIDALYVFGKKGVYWETEAIGNGRKK